MNDITHNEQILDDYLKSIGGLINGYYPDRPKIKSSLFCEVHDGWLPLIKELIEKLITAGWNKEICQIKQKFGGLRFYVNDASDECHKLINEYEAKSKVTCETCGEPGVLRINNSWLYTSCDKHATKGSSIAKFIYINDGKD
jgi:ribosomal protein L37AE/L43A